MVAVTNPASLTDPTLGPVLVSPPGIEWVDIGYATQSIKKGDPVIISGVAPNQKYPCSIANATGTVANGICLKTVLAGGTCEYAKVGEMDGYIGLTTGAYLTIVAGKIDTTAPAAGIAQTIVAVTPTRIAFRLL